MVSPAKNKKGKQTDRRCATEIAVWFQKKTDSVKNLIRRMVADGLSPRQVSAIMAVMLVVMTLSVLSCCASYYFSHLSVKNSRTQVIWWERVQLILESVLRKKQASNGVEVLVNVSKESMLVIFGMFLAFVVVRCIINQFRHEQEMAKIKVSLWHGCFDSILKFIPFLG
jgi:hypothetical protein